MEWTIGELAQRAAAALAVGYPGPPSGRVRDVPDARSIRWYTQLGLVDRPAAMRGRTALYGMRHLLQLVAIKRLQATGHSLADVQAMLAGATDDTLQAIAALPEPVDTAPAVNPAGSRATSPAPRSAFWKAGRVAATVQGVEVGDGVTVLVPARRALTRDDVTALRRAARELLNEIDARGLRAEGEGR